MDTLPVISVNKLSKYYGSTLGVHNINFTVNQGEIFGFLGPNGAGKTTTIRLLLDLLRPSSGEIKIFGDGIDSHSLEIRRRCGYLPGNFVAYSHMTGADFLRFVYSTHAYLLTLLPRMVYQGFPPYPAGTVAIPFFSIPVPLTVRHPS